MARIKLPSARDATPVYIAFSAFEAVCDGLREQGLPGYLDEKRLGRYSGSMQRQIVAGFKFLDLIDGDARVRSKLADLIRAEGLDHRAEVLTRILKDAYAPLFEAPLHQCDAASFARHFGDVYPCAASVSRKSIAFFVNAARVARLPLGDVQSNGRRSLPRVERRNEIESQAEQVSSQDSVSASGVSRRIRGRRASYALTESTTNPGDSHSRSTDRDRLLDLLDLSSMTATEQQAVWTLIKYLNRREVSQPISR